MKRFLVLLPRSFEVVGFLFLLVGFPFGAFLFLKLCTPSAIAISASAFARFE